MQLRTGIDILEIERVRLAMEKHGDRFQRRIFTPAEITECKGRADALAVRFAGKEAAVKALGTGIGPVGWLDVETLHEPGGRPYLVLHGNAEKIASSLGLTDWSISLSHSQSHAVAVVVAAGDH